MNKINRHANSSLRLYKKIHFAVAGIAITKVPVGYKLPRWLVEWLRDQDTPAARLIEDALKLRHKLKPPEGA